MDPNTSNDATQAYANARGVGTREDIEPRWSHGFGLEEMDA
jgi:hypothetical protein